MARAKRAPGRREDALSLERIVEVAIELLDEDGVAGLTFRALAARLTTGAGALYWHVANKRDLLIAATDAIVARAMGDVIAATTPNKAVRAIAAGVFEAVDAHPWVGAQLSRAPWENATLQIFERVGQQVRALGISGAAQFTAASALLSYILGVSVQNAEQGRTPEAKGSRADFLAREAERWKAFDAHEFPFSRSITGYMKRHDDRVEFLAGIDLLLLGISASR